MFGHAIHHPTHFQLACMPPPHQPHHHPRPPPHGTTDETDLLGSTDAKSGRRTSRMRSGSTRDARYHGGSVTDGATLQGIDLSMQELKSEVQTTLADQRREMKAQVMRVRGHRAHESKQSRSRLDTGDGLHDGGHHSPPIIRTSIVPPTDHRHGERPPLSYRGRPNGRRG